MFFIKALLSFAEYAQTNLIKETEAFLPMSVNLSMHTNLFASLTWTKSWASFVFPPQFAVNVKAYRFTTLASRAALGLSLNWESKEKALIWLLSKH